MTSIAQCTRVLDDYRTERMCRDNIHSHKHHELQQYNLVFNFCQS